MIVLVKAKKSSILVGQKLPVLPIFLWMEELWEKWISSLEMGGDNSFGQHSYMIPLEEDKFVTDFEPSNFSFENAYHSSTMQCKNNNAFSNNTIVDGATTSTMDSSLSCEETSLDHDEGHLKRNNSSNSVISEDGGGLHKPAAAPSQSTFILSFENSTMEPALHLPSPKQSTSATATHSSSILCKETTLNKNINHVSEIIPRAKQGTTKNFRKSSSTDIQDHIMAERKRRQVLTERFIALSATIPGLKKTDKAYILREAISYVKQLQERVKELENQNKRKKGNSVISIKKSMECTNEETNSCELEKCDSGYGFEKALPKVEARVLEKEILIAIHCEKQKDIVLRLMALLQNLHLSVASSSVLPFGTSTLIVTIIAQMDDEYCMTVNDLVKNLRQDLLESHDLQKHIF